MFNFDTVLIKVISDTATHSPFPPRSTYAPYIYGSDPDEESASKKKVVLALDRELITSWAKELMAYLAAPLLVPAAISNALQNTPPGLPDHASIWGKIVRSFRSVFLRRSENRDGNESLQSLDDHILFKMANKLKTSKLWQQLRERKQKEKKEKKERLVPGRLIDGLLRWKRHRTAASANPVVDALASVTN